MNTPSGGFRPRPLPKAQRTTKIRRLVAPGKMGSRVGGMARPGLGQNKPTAPVAPPKKPRAPYKDNQYFNDVAGAGLKRDSTLTALTVQRGQVDIGYGFDTDPTTNPYSRAALLQKSYDRSQRGTLNSMAAGGQLYSGAHSNARAGNTESYNQNYDSLRKSHKAELDRIRDREAGAGSTYDREIAAAGTSAIGRAAKDRPDGETAGYGKGKKGKKAKKRPLTNRPLGQFYDGGVKPAKKGRK